jgi:putative inorganic carbon (HCO3(-)) transporter
LSGITDRKRAEQAVAFPGIYAAQARTFTIWSLAVTSAILPLFIVRWHYGPLPTTLLETAILITAAAYVATLWFEKKLPERTPYDIPIALWLIAGVLGIIASPNHLKAAGTYRAYFVEAVAVFYIAVDMLRSRDDLRKFFALGAISASLFAIGQIVLFAWVAAHHQLQLGDGPAFLNSSANADALYLEPPLAFAAGFAAFGWTRRDRLVALGVLGLTLAAMVLTLSRGGYLAVSVLALVLVLYLPSRRLRIWVVGGIAVVALLVLEVPFIGLRISDAAHSAGLRSSIYSQALTMLAQRPILGAGIGGFSSRVAPFHPSGQEVEIYPHNVFLTTWSEVGLLGLIAFSIILFGLLWRGIRALPLTNETFRPVLWGAVGALVLFLIHGLFDSPYWKNDLAVQFWLVAALVVVAIRGARVAGRP